MVVVDDYLSRGGCMRQPSFIAIWWPPARLPVLVPYRGRVDAAEVQAVIGDNQLVRHADIFGPLLQRPACAFVPSFGTA
jgi:hypothetical protein